MIKSHKLSYVLGQNVREIDFDAFTDENHTHSSTVTQRNVEKGAAVTDNVVPQQDRISIEAWVSNTPIRVPTTQMRGIGGTQRSADLGQQVSRIDLIRSAILAIPAQRAAVVLPASAQVLQFDAPFDRVADVRKELLDIQTNARLCTIFTSLGEYTDMIISNLAIPRSAALGNAIRISFDAVSIRLVETEEVTARKQISKKKKGSKGKQEASPEKKQKAKSILDGWIN